MLNRFCSFRQQADHLAVNAMLTSIDLVVNTLGVVAVMAYMTVVLRVVRHRQKTASLADSIGIINFDSSNPWIRQQ